MRAVWSFWTKPFQANRHFLWRKREHYFLSWILSVQTARKHFPSTALFTDDEGARLLVDQLGLEFDEVSTGLNALSEHEPKFWALGKVWTYRAQTEAFVHLDSDVFLWKPLPESLITAPLLAQNPDFFFRGASYYRPEGLERSLSLAENLWLPVEWVWYRSTHSFQRGESCGIFGGADLDFIRHYANQAIKLVEHPDNKHGWTMIEKGTEPNILFEQYLLAACIVYHQRHHHSPYHNIQIRYLFDSLDEAFDEDRAEQAGFTHLISSAKRNLHFGLRIEHRVKRDYPDLYERCMQLSMIDSRVA